jgi:hypothetical protein
VKVVKQVEAADLETGKFLMDLENLRVLPVVGKDPKAKLFKFGGRKKNSIRGDTMMIRAVRPSVDRDDHPDWLYALPNELSSPEKPVGEVRATEHLATDDRMCCREHSHSLDHRHPRDHLKNSKKQQEPLEKTGSPPSASKMEYPHHHGSHQRKADKGKQRITISREQNHQYKVEKITLYQKYLIKLNHITTAVHDNRSIRAKEPLRTRPNNENNKTTEPN